jgi:hypothetical protein
VDKCVDCGVELIHPTEQAEGLCELCASGGVREVEPGLWLNANDPADCYDAVRNPQSAKPRLSWEGGWYKGQRWVTVLISDGKRWVAASSTHEHYPSQHAAAEAWDLWLYGEEQSATDDREVGIECTEVVWFGE